MARRKSAPKVKPIITHVLYDRDEDEFCQFESEQEMIEYIVERSENSGCSAEEYINDYIDGIFEVRNTLNIQIETTVSVKINDRLIEFTR